MVPCESGTDHEVVIGNKSFCLAATSLHSSQVTDKVGYLLKKGTARAGLLNIMQDKWIKDNSSADEQSLWGQMMILAEKDVAQADEEHLKNVSENMEPLFHAPVLFNLMEVLLLLGSSHAVLH